jgi:uncharacterized protein YdhG (YjbR/CyaY superfamily)
MWPTTMKGQIKSATSPSEYIAALNEPRRSEIAELHKLIRKTVPNLKPVIHSGMLGYGRFHYKYASGREGEACRIAVASNKTYISLYALGTDERGYVAERFKKRLPKASIGKSCVRFKRLEDVDPVVLKELLTETEKAGYGGN